MYTFWAFIHRFELPTRGLRFTSRARLPPFGVASSRAHTRLITPGADPAI